MRILVYGAGNIGCLYAAKLAQSGQDVVSLARGDRYNALREHGITLESEVSGKRTTISIPVVDCLEPGDAYDLVLVVLQTPAIAEVLPILAANDYTPSVMFFGNNASGPEPLISALGRERVLLGFPGAAAVPRSETIRYVITSRREQPTTIGEVDGGRSERIGHIASAFEEAGFPTSICVNMDAWLKTHVAKIVPTGGALFYAGGHIEQLVTNDEAVRLMVRAMREGLKVLRANDIPITPSNHRVLQWLPESLIVFLMKRMFSSETMSIKVGHAVDARHEFQVLAQEFEALNVATELPTPAMDRLNESLAPSINKEQAS
jgi:2-dehydropantoate 2-reductase